MIGSRGRVTSLLMAYLTALNINSLPQTFHCIIHQENLAAKTLGMEHVLRTVKKTVNFLRSKELKHQFKSFLAEVEAEFEDIPYYAEVRWLSKGKMRKRTYYLQAEILAFVKELHEFEDTQFLTDFAFLVDMLTDLNTLNTRLQGQGQIITDLYRNVASFHEQLELWEQELSNEQVDEESFPTLSSRPCLVGQEIDYAKWVR